MPARFVHLRLHTEYSLVDGIVRVPALMQAVAEAGMSEAVRAELQGEKTVCQRRRRQRCLTRQWRHGE